MYIYVYEFTCKYVYKCIYKMTLEKYVNRILWTLGRVIKRKYIYISKFVYDDDDDVYLNKLQTKGVKKSILYIYNVDQPIRHK
jgi:hypothetical protein